MNIRIVFLANDGENKKGDVLSIHSELAHQYVSKGVACFYSDFSSKMLEDLEGEADSKAPSKKKASKKD